VHETLGTPAQDGMWRTTSIARGVHCRGLSSEKRSRSAQNSQIAHARVAIKHPGSSRTSPSAAQATERSRRPYVGRDRDRDHTQLTGPPFGHTSDDTVGQSNRSPRWARAISTRAPGRQPGRNRNPYGSASLAPALLCPAPPRSRGALTSKAYASTEPRRRAARVWRSCPGGGEGATRRSCTARRSRASFSIVFRWE
jgi:hypothetical protein